MRQLGEQWVENDRMYKAVKGLCERCCVSHLCNLSADCPMVWGLIAIDLGPVNEDGVPTCPFCGEYPVLDAQENFDGRDIWFLECAGCGARTAEYFEAEEAINAWKRRA